MTTHFCWPRWGLALALFLPAACSDPPERGGSGETVPPQAASVGSIPGELARICLSAAGGRLPCPQIVPEARKPYRWDVFSPLKGHTVFFAEWSGPYPGIVRENKPPRFAHLVVQAGDLHRVLEFPLPTTGPESSPPEEPSPDRRKALLLDRPAWGGRDGILVLAPPFPGGGIEGDHLMFVWKEASADYSVSLHAWLPMEETITTLQAMVESIP
jgi:hypothetical protein